MKFINTRQLLVLCLVLVAAGRVPAQVSPEAVADELRQPELPPECAAIEVPAGNRLAAHVYAIGVQIYRWTGTHWLLTAPEANLYADPSYNGKVGIHYGGPRWRSNSGSWVQGRRLSGCSPSPSGVPWLLLEGTVGWEPGLFEDTTFIQRVNTANGLTPADPGTEIGEIRRVPYTAEYYFYKADR